MAPGRNIWRLVGAIVMLSTLALLTASPGPATATTTVALIAGQHINVGTVTAWVDGSNLCVRYATMGGWVLGELHLAVADSLEGIPQTRSGNPIPGRFAYSASFDPGEGMTVYTFCVPLDGLEGTIYIAAHAEVYKQTDTGMVEETAWAEGQPFPGHNWAMYFTYTVEQQPGPITM